MARARSRAEPVVRPEESNVRLKPEQWYKCGIFTKMKGDTLVDSLFLNERCIADIKLAMDERPGYLKTWHLGINDSAAAGIFTLDIDEIKFSDERAPLELSIGDKKSYSYNDTVRLYVRFPPYLETETYYIDLNFSSEKFKGEREERFGVLDTNSNLTFSLYREDRVHHKFIQGSNRFEYILIDSAGSSYPFNNFLADHFKISGPKGSAHVALRLTENLEPGSWTVNACLVSETDAALYNFPSLTFTLDPEKMGKPPLSARTMFILLVLLLLFFIVIFMGFRKESGSGEFPSNWLGIVDSIESFIHDNYSKSDLDSEKIAENVKLSVRRTLTIYQKVKGISPVQRLREVRIEKACDLLKTTRLSISEIAYRVGFGDPVGFQRNFKKSTGFTPGQYRDQK
jgi:AraC-like DNA-binding protein